MEDNRLEIVNAAIENDVTFTEKLAKCKDACDLQKVLNEIGVELNEDEAKEVFEQSKKSQNGELSESEMDNVAGGCGICFSIGIAIGYALGRLRR